jgi:hypothetical protein
MRRGSGWIVPKGDDQNVNLVVDDLGRRGRVYRETYVEATDLETVISDLLSGEYSNPVRVVAFNTAEQWSQDVSEDVAHELRHRCDLQLRDIPFGLQDFVDRYEGRYSEIQFPLPLRIFAGVNARDLFYHREHDFRRRPHEGPQACPISSSRPAARFEA